MEQKHPWLVNLLIDRDIRKKFCQGSHWNIVSRQGCSNVPHSNYPEVLFPRQSRLQRLLRCPTLPVLVRDLVLE